MFDTFGNLVKIKASTETDLKGLTGKTGQVNGETTPSMMEIEVIGLCKKDYAINVFFEEINQSFWIDADLIQKIDDGEGIEITLDGIDKKWTKGKNGEWIEENTSSKKVKETKANDKPQKKWWLFW